MKPLDKPKPAIKESFKLNKEGEVQLREDLQAGIAGGVTPEQNEEEGSNLNWCLNFINCGLK